jgi:putative transposase
MKGRSKALKTKQGKGYLMLSPTCGVQLELPLFVIAESVLPNKKTILNDKSNICESNSLMPKLSKTSVVDLTSKEKVFAPYWTDLFEEISSKLLLPVGIDCADSDSSYFNTWLNKTVENSWFSTKLFTVQNQNSPPIFSPSFTSSLVECTDSEVTQNRSRKIRIFLNASQKQILRHWFGVSRYVYNQTIAYLQQPDTVANWYKIKKSILDSLPEWAKSVPFQIKSIAIKDACLAVKKAKKDYKIDGKFRRMKFRSPRDKKQSIYIPKSAVKSQEIYHIILGKITYKEDLPQEFSDGRLVCYSNEYYVIVSEKIQPINTKNQGKVVSLGPGVRKMFTFFSENSFGFLGQEANLVIQKLCFKLDKLISKITKAKCKQKRRFKKTADRLRIKIQNLVTELHHKIAYFLVTNFDVILLPTFETSQMVSRSKRKIRSKSVRQMLTLSHYRFKEVLRWKAWQHSKKLVEVCEAYTSKTVSWTGEIVKVGGSEKIKSPSTGITMDRDLNGARGIFLRAVVDTPWLREYLNFSVC